MKRLWENLIRACLGASVFMLSLTTATLAQDINVPFLFSEDEKLDQTELTGAIPKSNALKADPYLNAPMTRLEYMLTRLESELNRETKAPELSRLLETGFESRVPEVPVSVAGYARYSKETGRITVGYRIEHLGRPKKPMRATCDALLSELKYHAPQENAGFLLHHMLLGVLEHENLPKYTAVMEAISKHVVHKVILESKTRTNDLRTTTHALLCQRTVNDASIQYERHSF